MTFSGIGRFVEEQTIDFTVLGSLVQVDGLRVDNNGSSGAGKTSVFNSLDYLFGVNSIPTTVLQSRYTKEGMSVTGMFDFDGRTLWITRGKGKLSVDLDGEIVTGSKLAEEKIDEIVGMPRELFRKILHKRQKEGGFFLQMTPSKTFEFLVDALGLAATRKHLDTVDIEFKRLTPKLETATLELGKSNSSLLATQNAIQALGTAPVSDLTQSQVLALKTEYEDFKPLTRELQDIVQHETQTLSSIRTKHTLQTQTLELERPKLVTIDDLSLMSDRQGFESVKTALESARVRHSHENQELETQRPKPDTSQPDASAIDLAENTLSALQRKKISLVQEENDRVSGVRSELSLLKLILSSLTHEISKGVQAKREALVVAQEIKKIRESICPTCEQGWVTDTAKTKEAELLDRVKEYKKLIQAGALVEASQNITITSIEALTPRAIFVTPAEVFAVDTEEHTVKTFIQKEKADNAARILAKNEAYRANLAIFSQKQRDLISAHSEELKAATSALEKAREKLTILQNKANESNLALFSQKQTQLTYTQTEELCQANLTLEKARDRLSKVEFAASVAKSKLDLTVQQFKSQMESAKRFETSLNTLRAQEFSAQAEIIRWETEAAGHRENLETAEEAKKVIKSYLSCSFDEALEIVGDTATRIIRGIPNMATATIVLEGVKETEEGRVKEEVNAVISMDGEEGIPIRSLSGGERSSVDLAVDLAAIDLLEAKSGKGIDLYVIDEGFTGMDTVCTEMALEVLKNSNLTKRLIIVEHNPIVSQMVTDKIMVHRDGQTSRIVQ